MARWIGVDYGTRRIGLAIGEMSDNLRIAFPAETLAASGAPDADARLVAKFAQSQNAAGIVVGLPLNMDGTVGPQAQLTQKFIAALRTVAQLPVETQDERLSSFAADEALESRGAAGRRAGARDALAAQVILKAFIDARAGGDSPPASVQGDE